MTTGTALTTGCCTLTTLVVCDLAPKESDTVVLMKGVNWAMIWATRLASFRFGAGAGLGAAGLNAVFPFKDYIL